MTKRTPIQRLSSPDLLALRCGAEDWPAGLFQETPVPDAWMGLVESLDGRRRFVPAGDSPRCSAGDRLVLVRNRRIAVPLALERTVARCGHDVRAVGEVLVYWPAGDLEIATMARALLLGEELTIGMFAARFQDAGAERALREYVRSQDAEALVGGGAQTMAGGGGSQATAGGGAAIAGGDHREAFAAKLIETLQPFLFDCAAMIDRVASLTFTSESLIATRAREREAAARLATIKSRELVEKAALEATRQRLTDLSSLFEKLRGAAGADGGRQWHELLPALAPAERSRLLENLWRIAPHDRRTRSIVAVIGGEAVWVDVRPPHGVLRRVALPGELGGLRSVRFSARGDGELLVGAARGVWRLRADDGAVIARHETPPPAPRNGFNSAVIVGDWLVATNSAIGCWRWNIAEAGPAVAVLAAAAVRGKTVRATMADEVGRVLFAVDDVVFACATGDAAAAAIGPAIGSPIHALAALGDTVFAAVDDGRVLRLNGANAGGGAAGSWLTLFRIASSAGPAGAGVSRVGGDTLVSQPVASGVESIAVRRWNDLTELVLPGGARGVLGLFVEEGTVATIAQTTRPVRRVWANDDLVVAMSEMRDRLVIIAIDGENPNGVELPLRQMLNESVQDVCLVG